MDNFLKQEYENFIPEDYKSAVNSVIKIADRFGVKIYLIGGAVRDLILGNSFKDIDITVEADAINFANILETNSDCKIISVQENLRTAKIEFNNGIQIDFASTRQEKYIASGVLPDAFDFGCELEKDIKRRDFTINTLALVLNGSDKYSLKDFCGGLQDLKNKKIKILHSKSFIDDPSRIIRALKFMIRLNFELEEKTKSLMNEYLSEPISKIPLERIKNELFQYFSIPAKGLYKHIIDYKVYKLFGDKPVTQFEEKDLSKLKNEELKFIYFAFLILNSDYEEERFNLISQEKKILDEVKWLLANNIQEKDDFEIYKKYNQKQELAIKIYYIITKDETVLRYSNFLSGVKVLITGNDLIKLGLKPSKDFALIFEAVLKEKLKGEIKSKEEEINFVKKWSR